MAKKGGQTRQARQVRRARPRGMPTPQAPQAATPKEQKKQRERYVQSGGLLQGYAPEQVLRICYYAVGVAALCVAIMLVFLFVLPLADHYLAWPVRIVAAVVWLVPVAFMVSFLLPGYQLARKDRRAEPSVIQGQLMGASPVSTSFGLGMLMVQTRGGVEQYLVPAERLERVPGNQVRVVVTVTPNLRHVRSVGVMGQSMMGRPEQAIPPVVKRLRLLPLLTPIALSAAAVVGADVVALLPIGNSLIHTGIAVLVALALAGAVYGITFLMQRRMYSEVQSLLPGGL